MQSEMGNLPAFPCEAQLDRSVPPAHDHIQMGIYSAKFPGMSLRDWFAGQALAGMHVMSLEGWTNKDIGLQAYSLADAMLAARAEIAKATGNV